MTETLVKPTRSLRLKAATHLAHDRLDKRIMAAQPFASREQYARFAQAQYSFHLDMERHFGNPALIGVVPDLAERRRLAKIEADLVDLGVPRPTAVAADHADAADASQATSLGWLYVAEGSSLGAAILLKLAIKLGLGEDFGARHLAGHADGRARHWREFTAALDSVRLSDAQEQAVVDGANAAFARVHGHVLTHLPIAA